MESSKKVIITLIILVLCLGSSFVGYVIVKNPKTKCMVYDPGDYFITNITDSKSLLKSDITLEIKDKKQCKELENNTFKIRDIIINVLRSKSYAEIKKPDIQDILKAQIKVEINEKLNGITIEDVYFNEFVIQ